jgi:hypothetical protein
MYPAFLLARHRGDNCIPRHSASRTGAANHCLGLVMDPRKPALAVRDIGVRFVRADGTPVVAATACRFKFYRVNLSAC